MGFALEPGDAIGIVGEEVRQDFDRDLPIQRAVVRAIHVAHAAATERGENLVMPDLPSNQRRVAIVRHHRGNEPARCGCPGRRGEKVSRLFVGEDQPFDLAPQHLVAAARRVEEPIAFAGRVLQRGVVDLLDLPPSLGRHRSDAFITRARPLKARTGC